MKKLLGIIVLGLLLSGNAFSEIIRLKCTLKSQDTQMRDDISEREPSYYNLDTNDTDSIITDSHISFYDASSIVDTHYLSYDRINRFDGSHILRLVEVPKSVSTHFKNLKGKYKEKDIKNLIINVDKFFFKNKISNKKIKDTYLEEKGECISLKKKF
jgi:hypothetical protein|tara:strand:- start:675 stop:1145 length:471 start_codon:yes stop_codon:yes gene_type:complete